jgi:hypothetical protein
MLKGGFALIMLFLTASIADAQTPVQKIVDSEHAFAARALEVGNPQAFVEYMTEHAWAFVPNATEAKPFWSQQQRDEAVLEWAPNFADAASDGSFGYTTGNWQIRPKKGAEPTAFGEFNTIWVRQVDGSYRWPVDIGTGHGKTAYSTDWKTSKASASSGQSIPSPAIPISEYEGQASRDVAAAYDKLASDDIRMIRKDSMPIIGKTAAKKALTGKITLGVSLSEKRSADMAYVLRPYTLTSGTAVERGNQLQVWKCENGKWRIVLDVLKPVPAK